MYIRQWVEVGGVSYPEYGYEPEYADLGNYDYYSDKSESKSDSNPKPKSKSNSESDSDFDKF